MSLAETLTWPFFEEHHRRFADELARWADATLPSLPHDDVDEGVRARVAALGKAGFLKACVPAEYDGLHPKLDVRTLCIARETLSFRDGLADFAFAMRRRHVSFPVPPPGDNGNGPLVNTELEGNVGHRSISLLEEIPPAGFELRRELAPPCLDRFFGPFDVRLTDLGRWGFSFPGLARGRARSFRHCEAPIGLMLG